MFISFWLKCFCCTAALSISGSWSSLSSSNQHNTFVLTPLLDVAERAFSKCVETNKGGKIFGEKVHADSRTLKVKFNYEFLEDFQDEQSPDKQSSCEEGATNIDTRYTPSVQIFLSLPAYLVIVMLYPQQY